MPAKQHSAQSSNAQAMLASRGAPAGLESFLGGFVAGKDPTDQPTHGHEALITMQLRLLNKSSDITKQKALNELIELVGTTREDIVASFVPNICEAVIQHAQDSHPEIRASVFTLLKALMSRSREVRVLIIGNLPTLSGVWVMAMNEMDRRVREEAVSAFESAFSAEKRPTVLSKYQDAIMAALFDIITTIAAESGRPLQDDTLDNRSNQLYSALRAVGYMVRQVSSTHGPTLSYMLDMPAYARVLPRRVADKNYVATKTPLVRSAALSLLRDVIVVCPVPQKMQPMISQAIHGALGDHDATVAARVWEVMLLWCGAGASEMVNYLPAGFFDDVIDSFMNCDKAELAEVIFPCLFPMLTQLSKDSRCSSILDEFCGALVEKLRLLGETPNVSAAELEVALTALMKCWELHCVRKKGTDSAGDSAELFTVITYNLCVLMKLEMKRRRYMSTVASVLSTSLLKTSLRLESIFRECMSIFCELDGCTFKVLPDDPEEALVTSFHEQRANTLGALYATASENATYGRHLPMYTKFLEITLEHQLASGDLINMAAMLTCAKGTLKPSKEMATHIVQALLIATATAEDANDAAQKIEACSPAMTEFSTASSAREGLTDDVAGRAHQQLVSMALTWFSAEEAQEVMESFSQASTASAKAAVRQYVLNDPTRLPGVLVAACRDGNFDDIKYCLEQLQGLGVMLSPEERAQVLDAARHSLRTTLAQVEGSDGDNNEVAPASTSAAADGQDSSDEDDENDSDDSDEMSSSSSGSDSASASRKESEKQANAAADVLYQMIEWAQLLTSGSALATMIHIDAGVFRTHFAEVLYQLTAGVAPRLYPEQYISIKAMRAALQRQQLDDTDDESEEGKDMLMDAMDAKTHFLKMADFTTLTEAVNGVLAAYGISTEERDHYADEMARRMLRGEVRPCYQATHQLQQALPFASTAVFQQLVSLPSTWSAFALGHSVVEDPTLQRSALSLFNGYFTLAQLHVRLTDAVRTAQLVRLTDMCLSAGGEMEQGPALFYQLLQAASVREALSHAALKILNERLLPSVFHCFSTREAAEELATLLTTGEGGENRLYLICTLAAVVRDMAKTCITNEDEHVKFLLAARRVVSAVTSRAVGTLFSDSGARGITQDVATIYNTFFSTMDEAANVVRDNILAQLPPAQERLMTEACCMLPTWDLVTARVSLVVHRHMATMPVVAPTTMMSLIQYAQKQIPLDGLELLAELSCTRIMDHAAYSELVRVIVGSLCRSYTLSHLPTNGRLQQRQADRAPQQYSFSHLMRVTVAATLARRGVIVHSRMDDVLRSTVNLVVFDCVCECVSRLRETQGADMRLLAKLIAFTADYMGDLLTADVVVIRASEASVRTIAQVMAFAYLWVRSTAVSKLEAIGMDTVAGVLRCVCLLSNLTLIRSKFSLADQMSAIIGKLSLTPVRKEFSAANPAKLALFRRQNSLITKTHKQKLLLFPYMLAWGIHLTTPPADAGPSTVMTAAANSKERRSGLYTLLDLIFSLLLTPTFKGGKRVEESFLGSAMYGEGEDGGGGGLGQLGFEMVALTRVDSEALMEQLARGGAAVFALLLHSGTLTHAKSWLETLERKSQALFFDFVGHYMSPLLIEGRLLSVLDHSPDGVTTFNVSDSYTVHVSVQRRIIDLSYEMEDAKVAVRIAFPSAYPLRQPTVEATSGSGKECGVSSDKWRSWMLRMTALLFDGSDNIWQCIELFQRNLDAHFNGQEPCPICFAVVHAVNHRLPDMRCSVCNNSAFHSGCLYTWWANGGQTVCPLCRSPWVAE